MSRPYAEVIGDPIAHSKSPLIHNFWLEKLGIDAEYRACHVRPDELADYFTHRRGDLAWRGCNVTMPHKQAVVNLVDEKSHDVADLDAANTVTVFEGRLEGRNTDIEGVELPIRELIPTTPLSRPGQINDMRIVQIVGAGGAAFAAAEGAERAGYANQGYFNRSREKAIELAFRFGGSRERAHILEELRPEERIKGEGVNPEDRYLIVNASPMGMRGKPPVPIDLFAYPEDTVVFDMVYDPLETPLLRAAVERGFRTIDGLQMLVGQAAAAFEHFFGHPAPRQHDAELRALLTR
jgi:shikimate dehydrogenase